MSVDYKYKLSVILTPLPQEEYFEVCLCSAGAAVAGMDAEVLVAEKPSETAGITAAYNRSILQSRGEYILLLQPDTVIGESLPRTLCCFMDEHPDAGGVGVRILRPYVRAGRRSAVPSVLPAPFLFLRREALDKAGTLAEDIPLDTAAADLSRRLTQSGFTLYYHSEAILHYGLSKPDISLPKPFFARFSLKRKRESALRGGKLLILCTLDRFPEISVLCRETLPPQQAVVFWDTDKERISTLLSRHSRMKGYSAYVFCHPDLRFEQMLFLIENFKSKLNSYHIYNAATRRLLSPPC
ncbi:MAG: hypothetical protein LBB27_03075 [Tannerellaceae bacterium]|jgi:hypothetical protein|nr:hypothetical protein [Tannerellaceae bacterium]